MAVLSVERGEGGQMGGESEMRRASGEETGKSEFRARGEEGVATWGEWGRRERWPGHPCLHRVLGQQLPGVRVKHWVGTAGEKLGTLVSFPSP